MNGSPGFAKLIGIVTDNSRRYLKSYLIELPKANRGMLQAAANSSISWERREQWAAQLVRGMSRLHAHSFLVGGLYTCNIPFIDDTASVQFWSFKERFEAVRKVGAYYPLEFLYVRDMPPTVEEIDSPNPTSKTDGFHLGLMLWLLADNKPRTLNSPVCSRMRCNERKTNGKQESNLCDLSHWEPIALPPLPGTIAKYFRDIVDACRREDPSARPAAREILGIFPSSDEDSPHYQNHHHQRQGHEKPQPLPQQIHKPDIETLVNGVRMLKLTCSLCGGRIDPTLSIHHCNSCHHADFNLYQTCCDCGVHCNDNDHMLVELGKIGSWTVPRRYYSCVKYPAGKRDVIDL